MAIAVFSDKYVNDYNGFLYNPGEMFLVTRICNSVGKSVSVNRGELTKDHVVHAVHHSLRVPVELAGGDDLFITNVDLNNVHFNYVLYGFAFAYGFRFNPDRFAATCNKRDVNHFISRLDSIYQRTIMTHHRLAKLIETYTAQGDQFMINICKARASLMQEFYEWCCSHEDRMK